MMYRNFATYYDEIYQAQGKDYEKEACRLVGLIEKYKQVRGQRLLDIGCGTGEHLRYLQKFYAVDGLDLSEEMLSIARERLPNVPLHQGDMRTFKLKRKFDAIVCLFGVIGYAMTEEALSQCIANMGQHLEPGGVLVVEPWLGPEDVQHGRTHAVLVDKPDVKIARLGVTKVKGLISEIEFHFLVVSPEGAEYFKEVHLLGLYPQQAYERAFKAAGLDVYFESEGLSGRGLFVGVKPVA